MCVQKLSKGKHRELIKQILEIELWIKVDSWRDTETICSNAEIKRDVNAEKDWRVSSLFGDRWLFQADEESWFFTFKEAAKREQIRQAALYGRSRDWLKLMWEMEESGKKEG